MQLCFFEDHICTNFHPLTLSRPADDLRLGILTIAQKWNQALDPAQWTRITREPLRDVFSHSNVDYSKPSLWINSRYLPSNSLISEVQNLNPGTSIKDGEMIVVASVDGNTARQWVEAGQPNFSSLLVLEGQGFTSITQLWDLFLMNVLEISNDLQRLEFTASSDVEISPHSVLENKDRIYIGKGACIEAGAILTADDGPIYIGEGATVMAGSLIRGPAAICENATVKMGTKIYPGTTIGPVCKVGGEINNSIFHSYSNKGHDGFVGNSLIGQWCNLGADTNTSNLKNNYSTIRITDWQSRSEIETGQQFMGAVLGDHTKTAINVQLNTGTVCGVSCNIFAGDFPPKFIPSFNWVGSNVIQPYKLEKAYEAMEAMMARRDVPLTDPYKALMQHLFKQEHK